MSASIRRLPEFLRFKKDMEAAGQVVAIYDDGTPYVHTQDPFVVAELTAVGTEYFPEKFDEGATKCLFPVPVDDEEAGSLLLAAIGQQS